MFTRQNFPRFFVTALGLLLAWIRPASAKTPMQAYVEAMQPGWNLGNTLDATPNETAWGNPLVTQELIQQIKAQGFNSIRIPITWDAGNNRLGPAPDYTIDPAFLDRVQQVVDWSLDAGLYVMINVHHDSYWVRSMPANHDAVLAKFNAIWSQVAPRFRDYSNKLMFESINEPTFDGVDGPTKSSLLNELNVSFYDIVRGTGGGNATRPLVLPSVETNNAQDYLDSLAATMTVLNDPNLIATIHFYGFWPFSVNIAGVTTVNDAVINDINTAVNNVYNTFVANGIPVIVGELGLLSYGGDTPTAAVERGEVLKFFETFTAAARAKGLTWQLWDAGQLFDRTTYQWKDAGLVTYCMQSLTGRSTTANTDLLFLKSGAPVQDAVINLNLNGNTFNALKDGSTLLTAGSDYTLSGSTLTIKAKALSKYATGAYGEKAVFSVNVSSGPAWKLHVRYVDVPTCANTTAVTGGAIVIPLAYHGDLVANMEAKYADGSYPNPGSAGWTSFQQFGDNYQPDYVNNTLTLTNNFVSNMTAGTVNLAVRFWSGRIANYQLKVTARTASGGTEYSIYGDALQAGWNDWSSWTTHNLSDTTQVHSGANALSITFSQWGGVGLQNGGTAIDTSGYHTLVFWVHGGTTGGQKIGITPARSGTWGTGIQMPAPVANTWQKVEIPLTSFGIDGAADISGFLFQDWSGGDQPTVYLDDIALSTAQSTAVMDVAGAVPAAPLSITKGGFTLNRRTNRMVQTVTIRNTSGSTVTGPICLVLDSLSANTTLANAGGTTGVAVPTGSPYVLVSSGSLAPLATATVTLEFTVPASGGITYDARTVSGGSAP